jgi:hypothetical protein
MRGVFPSPTSLTTADVLINFSVPCFTTTINAANFGTVTPYQIVYNLPNSITVASFSMHTDTNNGGNLLKCGPKVYTLNQPWASLVMPADPVTTQIQLQINTNDALLAGSQTVTLTVKFQNPLFTATLDDTVTVTLLHPCKVTTITSSQTIPDITYGVTTAAVLTPFTAFTDNVSALYPNPPLLCGLSYHIENAATAAADGVTISGMNIRVQTNDLLLIGTTVQFHLFANSTP